MSLKDVDITAALRRLADRRIEDAMKEGKFDNLAGKGKPLNLEPIPAEENARLMWWALRILRNNDVTPDEVRYRKAIETLKLELEVVRDQRKLKMLVAQINAMVMRLNTLGTNAMNGAAPVVGVSMEAELLKLRKRARDAGAPGTGETTVSREAQP
jgi:hypothetical protein